MKKIEVRSELNDYRSQLFNIKIQLKYLGYNKDDNEALKIRLMYIQKELKKKISSLLREERLGGKKK